MCLQPEHLVCVCLACHALLVCPTMIHSHYRLVRADDVDLPRQQTVFERVIDARLYGVTDVLTLVVREDSPFQHMAVP